MGVVLGGMIVSLGVMWGYRLITPTGFLWFGPSVIVGFVAALGVLAAVMITRLLKPDDKSADATSNDETRR